MTNEFEIDLRKYIIWILRSWVWILSLAVIAAVGGLLFSALRPLTYQAFAMVVVTRSNDIFNFDPKIYSNETQPNYKVYLDLANSDQLKLLVYKQLSDAEQASISFDVFQKEVATASKGIDESVIIFSVILDDADQAARLANFWAQAFTQKTNQLFSGQDDAQLKFYQNQLTVAIDIQKKADQALTDFQAKNRLSVLSNQLNSYSQEQKNFLALLQNITNLEQNVSDFRAKIASKPSGSSLAQAEELNMLLMQIQTYNSQLSGTFPTSSSSAMNIQTSSSSPNNIQMSGTLPTSNSLPNNIQLSGSFPSSSSSSINIQSPLQINIENANLSSTSSSDALAALDRILKSISIQKEWTKKRLTELEPLILTLQQNVQTFYNEQTNLTQAQTVALDTVVSLNRKVQEVSISIEFAKIDGPVKVSSEATTPSKPVSRNLIRNSAMAAVVGLFLGVLGVFLRNWWQENEPLPQKELLPEHS